MPRYGARICLELRTCGVDVEVFSALLRYLYTGDLSGPAGMDMGLLRRLGEEFGHPASLEHDLRYLLETGIDRLTMLYMTCFIKVKICVCGNSDMFIIFLCVDTQKTLIEIMKL